MPITSSFPGIITQEPKFVKALKMNVQLKLIKIIKLSYYTHKNKIINIWKRLTVTGCLRAGSSSREGWTGTPIQQ